MVSMPGPRLLILSFSPIASDARVLKQVRLFTDRYHVTTCGYGEAPDGVADHIRIPDELTYWAYPRTLVMVRRYAAAYWRNPVVAHLVDQLSRGSWDVVLADDVDTVPLALELGARHGVHVDLHEYAPRVKEDLARWRLFVAPFMRWICRNHVTRAQSVTTVSEGIAREYEREFGIRADVVTNAAPYADLTPTTTSDPIRLVHSGAARADRHLELMVEAVRATTRPVTLDLYLTANDVPYLEQLKAQVAPDERITIHEPVPYSELVRVLNGYDCGIFVLPPVNFNYRWALPNKFFDFVQARLGVVIGPSPEAASLIRRHGLGLVTDDFTAKSLTAALEQLTAENVDAFKAAAHASALELSAQSQVRIWARSVDALAGLHREG